MFGIGGGEILVVALVALLLFGNEDLPKNMRKMVKAWNDFRGVTNDLQRSWLDVRDQVTRDLMTEQNPKKPELPQENASSAGAGSEENPVPPPEGLHDGVLGKPFIQRASGSLPQDENTFVIEDVVPPQTENSPVEPANIASENTAAEIPETQSSTIGKST
jgi:Sec-independent protein translocase protein TatA